MQLEHTITSGVTTQYVDQMLDRKMDLEEAKKALDSKANQKQFQVSLQQIQSLHEHFKSALAILLQYFNHQIKPEMPESANQKLNRRISLVNQLQIIIKKAQEFNLDDYYF